MKKEDMLKKIKLDRFEEIDNYFEITTIKDEEFLSREIRRCMADKFDSVVNMMNKLLHPDTNIIDLNDSNCLDLEDRQKMVDILKEFSDALKMHYLLEVDPKDDTEFIKHALDVYKKHMAEIKRIIIKTKDAKLQNDIIKENINYLG